MSLDIVVAGYIVKDGKVLLIDHKKLNKWLPCGGHIEKDETPDAALRREVKEELGIEIEFLQYPTSRRGNEREYALPFHVNVHHVKDNHMHYCLFYVCKLKSNEIKPNLNELNGYKWFSAEELDNERVPYSVKLESLQALSSVST